MSKRNDLDGDKGPRFSTCTEPSSTLGHYGNSFFHRLSSTVDSKRGAVTLQKRTNGHSHSYPAKRSHEG